MPDYIPRPGDIVKFPGAPVEDNQERLYEIVDADIRIVSEFTDRPLTVGHVVFRPLSGNTVYYYRKMYSELRDVRIELVRSADKLDPTWKGE